MLHDELEGIWENMKYSYYLSNKWYEKLFSLYQIFTSLSVILPSAYIVFFLYGIISFQNPIALANECFKRFVLPRH